MKHEVMCKAEHEELVYENWLRLAECIVTPTLKNTNYYLKTFYDKKEEKKNYEKIDYIRELGTMTKSEYEMWLYDFKNKMNKQISCGPKTRVTNKYAGTKKVYKTLKEACEDNDIRYKNLLEEFKDQQTKKVKYKGLIFEKLK